MAGTVPTIAQPQPCHRRRVDRAVPTERPRRGGTMPLSFSHLGICVSDLERSERFYCEGLGFEEVTAHQVGNEFAALMEVDDVELRSRMLRRGRGHHRAARLRVPGAPGDGERRADEPARPHPSVHPGGRRGRGGCHHRGPGRRGGRGHPDHLRRSPVPAWTSCTAPIPTGCGSSSWTCPADVQPARPSRRRPVP